ncbi:MAG: hypothetical protein AB2563_11485 [Candidatus Thiodiazotropha endolucinida]
MTSDAKSVLLPVFTLTTTCKESDPGVIKITIPGSSNRPQHTYHSRPVRRPTYRTEELDTYSYNRIPIVLNGDGSPWAEASLYILSRLESDITPNMTTYHGIGDDLSSYRRYLEDEGLDFTKFPQRKLHRPTYRYRGSLKHQIEAQEISPRTAQRKIGSVIQFYRWLIQEGLLIPEYPPWSESDIFILFKNPQGFSLSKQIKTTNLRIRSQKQSDSYSELIFDSGQLRPLSPSKQKTLIEVLIELGNLQMTLIHLIALFTGARIQTILTLRVRHVRFELPDDLTEIRFLAGPGTGVDTKNDKRLSIFIPRWLYEKLRIYSYSKDSIKRRLRAGDNSEDQYLFLSNHGAPLYTSKSDQINFNAENKSRHINSGQNVRQFIARRVIPQMRKKLDTPSFKYKFHDLRATYGMNLTDQKLSLVKDEIITLQQAREFVKSRMGHQSHVTTDLYLNYRQNIELVRQVQYQFEEHLKSLIKLDMNEFL